MFETSGIRNKFLINDNFGRHIDYLRLSITDLCNLRCSYCMPNGISDKVDRKDIMTWEEILRIINIFTELGITKLRLTGGEPFARKGFVDFLPEICSIKNLKEVYITTNGTLINEHIQTIKKSGIKGINLSLDAVDAESYKEITGHDSFEKVYSTFLNLMSNRVPVKINTVVSDEMTSVQIIKMAELAENYPVEVRFIEQMPFNGETDLNNNALSADQILKTLHLQYGRSLIFEERTSNANIYSIGGFRGKIGIIAAHSRTFCSTCNRIRITAKGKLKNCLYGAEILDLKLLMRDGMNDYEIKNEIIKSAKLKFCDGFEAFDNKQENIYESMSVIGG